MTDADAKAAVMDAVADGGGAAHADDNAPADGSDRLRTPPYRDANFYQKRKKHKFRQVEAPALEGPVADTHCHLHLLEDPALELARCAMNGVGFLCVVTDPAEDGAAAFEGMAGWQAAAPNVVSELRAAEAALEAGEGEDASAAGRADAAAGAACAGVPALAERSEPQLPRVRIAAGVHPHNARLYDDVMEARLRHLLADPRTCAIGEIGLDYHYDFSPRADQVRVFRAQIRLAHELGLPIALHVREAHAEVFAILEEEGFPEAGVLLHCCALSPEEIEPWVAAGCYIAYGGPLTFKKAEAVREGALLVPEDRLLTETDSPYMTPEPMRGVGCTPAHVVFTAAELARVREADPGEARRAFLARLMDNAQGLLNRAPLAWQER